MLRSSRIRWGLKALLVASLFLVVGCGSISGTVSSCGAPLPGVTVELKGAACATAKTTTDASGNYRFPWLAKGTYTVTPLMKGFSFTPANQTVVVDKTGVKGVNFDAGSGGYSISGLISVTTASGTAPLPEVTVELTGVASVSTTTDASGNYRFACLAGGDYTVTPLLPGYGFTPASQDVTLNVSTTLDFDAAPNTAWAWGANDGGQLGNGQSADSPVPVQVIDLSKVVAVAAGEDHSLALLNDGTVWAWGLGTSGQLGHGQFTSSNEPVQVINLSNVKAIAAGAVHSLALLNDGTVRAWGLGADGQLGNGQSGEGLYSPVPVQVSSLNNVKAIAAGTSHSLALLNDGTVWGWGNNGNGQLGVDDINYLFSPVPVQARNLTRVTAIACGWFYSLAIGEGGTVWTWGDNSAGQLGRATGGFTFSSMPGQVLDIINISISSIAAGAFHTIAATTGGAVWAWGLNSQGQLAINPSTPGSPIPVEVTGLSGVAIVAAGGNYSVVTRSDGSVWAWGENTSGQLGRGNTSPYEFTPAAVENLTNIIQADAGDYHALVVKSP